MVDVIVLGLDGANWNLVDPWLKTGRLPNLQTLRSSGTHGDLESCLPPVTCPNWRCYSTGKNPGNLGAFWWERIDTEARSLSTPNSRSFHSHNYWDYLNDEEESVGIVNLPMTYPPFEIDDYMIAGGPGSEATDYATPDDVQNELDELDYALHPPRSIRSPDDYDAAADIVDLVENRFSTFLNLLQSRDVDMAHLTAFYSNVLQHWFWRDEPTKQVWDVIDRYIGRIRHEFPEATLVLMSDHGCRNIETVFYVNSWLEREGYLVTEGSGSLFQNMGISQGRILAAIEPFDILQRVASKVPNDLKDRIPEDDQGFKRDQKLELVNWEHSTAVASGQGLVYVIDEEVRDQLMTDLRDAQSPITGDPIASDVYAREEVYSGPYVDLAPDIVFDQYPGVHTPGVIGDNPAFTEPDGWQAENVRTGLYLFDGPAVEKEGPAEASITDIAPTLLHAMNCAIPSDMDGTPLDVFPDDPEYCDPLPYEDDDGIQGSKQIKSRLEDLGYLG